MKDNVVVVPSYSTRPAIPEEASPSASREFRYQPSHWVPFRDLETIERVRRITREQITQHPNPWVRIFVLKGSEIEFYWLLDMFRRIKQAADEGRRLVLIMPNPYPGYRKLAAMLNQFKVDCRQLYVFSMDEYADEEGRIAPDTWPFGLVYAMKKYFFSELDESIRPPERQFVGLTNSNLRDYGRMIEDVGGADCCYSGPGWTGHLAFADPDAPEFQADSLEEWKQMGARIVTLSPFTIAQQSLNGIFGMSGDLAAVPPKGATIGPKEVLAARFHLDLCAITVHGTATSWQRFITRLVIHGPVTPKVPESILQTVRTDFWISETNAQDIRIDWEKGY